MKNTPEIEPEKPKHQEIIRDAKGRFPPGTSGNTGGKPTGTLDFKTKWLRFIDKVAEQNNITPDEVNDQLLTVAFKQAKDGSYPFWKDIQDRVHGKAQDKVDITTTGESINNIGMVPELLAIAEEELKRRKMEEADDK